MPIYIHQLKGWPGFTWNKEELHSLLTEIHSRTGRLLGKIETLGFELQDEAILHTLTQDVIKSSEIEGEVLDEQQVRSSIARRLGMDIAGLIPADRHVDGVVEMMLDATQHYNESLTDDRLFGWQSALFPGGRSGLHKVVTGAYRNNTKEDPMQVVSGAMGRETVHFEAPAAERLASEMQQFISWFNEENKIDAIVKAAIAHLWFVTIHPFDDGNGRIARAITDMQLARADETSQRFYSMSSQIRKERKGYYEVLEATQKGDLEITEWLQWFTQCLLSAVKATDELLADVLTKAKFWKQHGNTVFNDRQKQMVNKLLDGFDSKLNTSKWAKITKSSPDTALRDIQDLIEKKVLEKEAAGGRSTSYMLVIAGS